MPKSGLSPPARGSHSAPTPPWSCSRTIPTHAGGAESAEVSLNLAFGLSPLAQGNQEHEHVPKNQAGPIPASAGEPSSAFRRSVAHWVYPRSLRGGASMSKKLSIANLGLSPLAWGKSAQPAGCNLRRGPIPARAGKTSKLLQLAILNRVYPRLRGGRPTQIGRPTASFRAYPRFARGTATARMNSVCLMGLSPLERGNRVLHPHWQPDPGPISVRAGSPFDFLGVLFGLWPIPARAGEPTQ
jgi:hypothetical protein